MQFRTKEKRGGRVKATSQITTTAKGRFVKNLTRALLTRKVEELSLRRRFRTKGTGIKWKRKNFVLYFRSFFLFKVKKESRSSADGRTFRLELTQSANVEAERTFIFFVDPSHRRFIIDGIRFNDELDSMKRRRNSRGSYDRVWPDLRIDTHLYVSIILAKLELLWLIPAERYLQWLISYNERNLEKATSSLLFD